MKPNTINKTAVEQQQATNNPSVNGPARLDLSSLCLYKRTPSRDETVKGYLEYVKTIYPNKSNNLGVLMHGQIDQTKALHILKTSGYDVNQAKLRITFPALVRMLESKGRAITHCEKGWSGLFEKYVGQNSMLHTKNEATHFVKVLDGISKGHVQMDFEELSELMMEARSNKFKIPGKVKRLFEESFNGSREIEKMLEGSKKIDDLEILMNKVGVLMVKPRNLDRLREFLHTAKLFEGEIKTMLVSSHKTLKDMQSKFNTLKILNLKSSNAEPIQKFKKLWEKTYGYIEEIQQIVNPYNTKSNQRKSNFNKSKEMLEFFLEEGVQDQKIESLLTLVFDTERLINVAMMYLEDDQMRSESFLNGILDSLKNGKFELKVLVKQVSKKKQYIDLLCELETDWRNEDKIEDNQEALKKLKEMPVKVDCSRINLLEERVRLIARIK